MTHSGVNGCGCGADRTADISQRGRRVVFYFAVAVNHAVDCGNHVREGEEVAGKAVESRIG